MAKKTPEGGESDFHASIRGLILPAAATQRIETEIRRAVLQELAAVDFKGDLQISPLDKFPTAIRPGGGTMGIVAEVKEGMAAASGGAVLYGVPIMEALHRGDLAEMKQLAAQANEILEKQGDLKGALDSLKRAIAEAEA